MKLMNVILGSALIAVSLTAGAHAQYPYQGAPYQPPQHPASWSFDPYTSGLGPCVQKDHKDLAPCSAIMPPTYGQPSYWPR
jgi:hypothetical protein